MKKENNIIQEIKTFVKEFLKENGGMDNGYETTIEGECDSTNEFSELKFHTPQTKRLTFIEHDELCNDLTNEIVKIVDKILDYKQKGKDTSDLENQIDKMVYKLYDLTNKEIKIIEGGK